MPIPFRNAALALALAAIAGSAAAEGAFAQLYAARPPAGSSFVRLVNPDAAPLRVQIAGGPAQEPGAAKPATTYAIVKGNQPFTVLVDGKPAASLQVAPDTFTTLIPRRTDGKLTFAVIDDSNGAQDALKAELRFYNLAADCPAGQLGVSPSGPALFQDVKPGASAARHQPRQRHVGGRLRRRRLAHAAPAGVAARRPLQPVPDRDRGRAGVARSGQRHGPLPPLRRRHAPRFPR